MVRIYTANMSVKKLGVYREFCACIEDIASHPEVLKLKNYVHHNHTTRYDHSRTVAYYNFVLCRKLGLDAVSAARAGMLHDFFCYEWREVEHGDKQAHYHNHPKAALANAEKYFELNDCEREVIAMHMYPRVEGGKRPRYRETYCIALVDKYCAVLECSKASRPIERRRKAKLAFALHALSL